jgi:hypothetical protein
MWRLGLSFYPWIRLFLYFVLLNLLVRSTVPNPVFEDGVEKRYSGSTLSIRPERSTELTSKAQAEGKPRHLWRGAEGLNSQYREDRKGDHCPLFDWRKELILKRILTKLRDCRP